MNSGIFGKNREWQKKAARLRRNFFYRVQPGVQKSSALEQLSHHYPSAIPTQCCEGRGIANITSKGPVKLGNIFAGLAKLGTFLRKHCFCRK